MGLAKRARPDPELCPAGLHPWQPPFKQTPEGPICLECYLIYQRMWARHDKRKGAN